jgi:hypothetical protein
MDRLFAEWQAAIDYTQVELAASLSNIWSNYMTDFNAKAIQSVPRADIIARSVIGDKTLALLSRAEGLNLLQFADFERRTHGVLPLDADNDVRNALQQGYGVDRIETLPDGTGRAHVSKVVGLNYPVPAGQ